MIYYHDFLATVPQYSEKGRANDFPDVECCPNCRAKNGFYERNAVEMDAVYRIPICLGWPSASGRSPRPARWICSDKFSKR